MRNVLLMRHCRMKVAQGTSRPAGRQHGLAGWPADAVVSSELTLIRLPLSGRSR